MNFIVNLAYLLLALLSSSLDTAYRLQTTSYTPSYKGDSLQYRQSPHTLQMNVFSDAVRFFTNMNKEASAKHILMSGPEAFNKLNVLKEELSTATDVSAAFSELAAKVSECPSAKRGGNLGTFKPGMMVKEIDRVCFEKEVGVVHGPVETQFGSHLIFITRRYEGENEKK